VILWARVSPELDRQFEANIAEPIRLWQDAWTSGDIFWLVQAVGAPEALRALVEHLRRGQLGAQVVKFRTQDADGKYIAAKWTGSTGTMGTGT
jgi:hypothetical protein